MRLDTRLKALEQKCPEGNPVTVVLTEVFDCVPVGPPHGEVRHAQILPNATQMGLQMSRMEDETEGDFLARVDASHVEIHGHSLEG